MVGLSPLAYLIIISLSVMLIMGVLDGLSKRFVKRYGTYRFMFYRNFSYVSILIIILFLNVPLLDFEPIYWIYTLLISVVAPFSLAFMLKAVEKGEVGLVSSVTNSKVIVSVLFGIIFLGEKVSGFGWLMLSFILLGLVVLLVDFKKFRIQSFGPWIIYALAAGGLWGVLGPLYGIVSKVIGVVLFTFILESGVFIYAWINVKRENIKIEFKKLLNKEGIYILIYAVFGVMVSMLLSYAFSLDNVAVTSAIISSAPLVTVLYGRVVYKEKLTVQQYIAIVIVVSGVVLFSLYR